MISLTISEGQFRADQSRRQRERWQITLNKLIRLATECIIPVWVRRDKYHNLRKMLLKATSMPRKGSLCYGRQCNNGILFNVRKLTQLIPPEGVWLMMFWTFLWVWLKTIQTMHMPTSSGPLLLPKLKVDPATSEWGSPHIWQQSTCLLLFTCWCVPRH